MDTKGSRRATGKRSMKLKSPRGSTEPSEYHIFIIEPYILIVIEKHCYYMD